MPLNLLVRNAEGHYAHNEISVLQNVSSKSYMFYVNKRICGREVDYSLKSTASSFSVANCSLA